LSLPYQVIVTIAIIQVLVFCGKHCTTLKWDGSCRKDVDWTYFGVWDLLLDHPRAKQQGSPTNENDFQITSHASAPSSGRQLAMGCNDGSMLLWDCRARIVQHWLLLHKSSITCCSYDRRGQLLAVGDASGLVSVWDLRWGVHVHHVRCVWRMECCALLRC
jgi:WD40 repeat protein